MNVREQIFAAIKTALQTSTNIKVVERNILPFEHISSVQFPICQIEDLGDSAIEYKTGGIAAITMNVNFKLIVKAEYKDNATLLNNADADVVKILGNNEKLGGLVSIMMIENREQLDIETTYPYVAVIRTAKVIYTASTNSGF